MTSSMELHAPPPFAEGETDWKSYIKIYDMYFMCANINDPQRKLAMLLYCGGNRIRHVHETLGIQLYDNNGALVKVAGPNDEQVDIDPYKVSVAALKDHFEPNLNATYERHKFRTERQLENEQTCDFVSRLRKLAQTCDFDNYSTEQAIVDQYIETCTSSKLRRQLLKETDVNMKKLMDVAKAFESSSEQAGKLEKQLSYEASADATLHLDVMDTGQVNLFTRRTDQRSNSGKMYCYGCGAKDHIHGSKQCPAVDKTCFNCNSMGHFASVCRKPNRQLQPNRQRNSGNWGNQRYRNARAEANVVTSSPPPDSVNMSAYTQQSPAEYLFMVGDKHKRGMVCVDDVYLNFIIDSGSTVNIIDHDSFKLLKASTKLHKTDIKVFTYGAKQP